MGWGGGADCHLSSPGSKPHSPRHATVLTFGPRPGQGRAAPAPPRTQARWPPCRPSRLQAPSLLRPRGPTASLPSRLLPPFRADGVHTFPSFPETAWALTSARAPPTATGRKAGPARGGGAPPQGCVSLTGRSPPLFQRSSRSRKASCGPACPSAPASKRSPATGH